MVITVTCPSCSSSFPVDPAKIPEGGVNARCTQCGDIFRVEKPAPPSATPAVAEAPPAPPAPEVPATPATPELAEPLPTLDDTPPLPEVPSAEPAAPEPPPMPEPTAPEPPAVAPTPDVAAPAGGDPFAEPAPFEASGTPAAEPTMPPAQPDEPIAPAPAADTDAQPVKGFTFGKRDPTDKARRLARVLVSDMIMYNAERHQSALSEGTLVQDFEDEIEKSWKEYVEQVGEEMANGPGRQFWTEALNDILAKGKQVF